MKKILNILLVAVLALGVISCEEKKPVYKPAAAVEGQGVFFAPGQPASFKLDNTGVLEINISRSKSDESASIALNTTADAVFVAPQKANFAAGQTSAKLVFEYDVNDLAFDVPYEFSVKVAEQTTPYGVDSYSFTAVLPSPVVVQDWEPIATTPVFENSIMLAAFGWEVQVFTPYVEKKPGKNIWRIANIHGIYEKDGVTYTNPMASQLVADYITDEVVWTYIDADGELLRQVTKDESLTLAPGEVFIPIQSTNLEFSYGPMDFGTAAYNLQTADGPILPSDKHPLGVYDPENQSITFGAQMLYLPSEGWFGPNMDTKLYLDESLMVEDFNDPAKYMSLNSGSGVLVSEMFASVNGNEFPQEFTYGVEDESLYYLPAFFGEGFGLPFYSTPFSELEEEADIVSVDAFLPTGLVVLGRTIIANLKKGKVTMVDGLPTFELQVQLIAEAEGDNEALDFGVFVETVNISELYENYYLSDYNTKVTKEDICGDYDLVGTSIVNFFGTLYKEPVELSVKVIDIADQDVDADGVADDVVVLTGLSPYGQTQGWDDAVAGVFKDGVITFLTQTLFPFTYNETESPVYVLPNVLGNTSLTVDDVYAGIVEKNGKFAITVPTKYNEYLFFSVDHSLIIDEFERTSGTKVESTPAAMSEVANRDYTLNLVPKGMTFNSVFNRLAKSTENVKTAKVKQFNGQVNSPKVEFTVSKQPSRLF